MLAVAGDFVPPLRVFGCHRRIACYIVSDGYADVAKPETKPPETMTPEQNLINLYALAWFATAEARNAVARAKGANMRKLAKDSRQNALQAQQLSALSKAEEYAVQERKGAAVCAEKREDHEEATRAWKAYYEAAKAWEAVVAAREAAGNP